MQRQHSLSINEARSKLGIPTKGEDVPCPVCGRVCSRVRGAVLKHMMAAHGLTLEEGRAAVGMVCKKCNAPLPRGRHDRDYCSNKCGQEGSKESSRRRILDQTDDQRAVRLAAYYETMEDRHGRPVSPAAITKYVEGLGFEFREPYLRSAEKMKLKCLEGHNFTRTWGLFREYPTCTICGKIDRFYTVEKINNRLSTLGYALLTPSDFENGIVPGEYLLEIRCRAGHTYQTPCMYVLRDQQVCPHCNRSKDELEIAEWLRQKGHAVEVCNRSIAKPFEIDIVLPEKKLAIEFCGLYWHSEKFRPDSMYHRRKLEVCERQDYRLLTVFSDEWADRKLVCLSRILNAIGSAPKGIGARQCSLLKMEKSAAKDFFDDYHLQGSTGTTAAWGLFHDDRLVQCLSLGPVTRQHTKTGKMIELKRFASVDDVRVQGGFSRLLKAATSWARGCGYSTIKSYCDLRWGTGKIYAMAGFRLKATSRPSPWYTDGHRRLHAFTMRKRPEEQSSGKTEAQLRADQGYWRIWDCGHQTWVLEL